MMSGSEAGSYPNSPQQAMTNSFCFLREDNRRNVTTHRMRGNRNRSLEVAVPQKCCFLEQKNKPEYQIWKQGCH